MVSIFRGNARIQKIAFPTTRDFVQDTAKFQRMRVQLSFRGNDLPGLEHNTFDIHVNDRITVVRNDADPIKVGEHIYVHGEESSSNPWERTLTCQNNMKQVSV
jgi:hypothetical protein